MSNDKIICAVYDIDNTLIDSNKKLTNDVVETFARMGKQIKPSEVRGDWYALAENYGLDRDDFDKEFENRESWESSIKRGIVRPFPEAYKALDEVRDQRIRMMALSRSIPEYTDLKLDLLGPVSYTHLTLPTSG